MINKRFTSILKSIRGNEYIINVKPADSGSPAPRTFNASADGFTLSYKGASDSYLDPVRSSEVVIVAHVENEEFAEFLNDIAQEQEQSYVIEILKKQIDTTLYDPFWSGYIWPENIQQSYGSYPYTVSLRASDATGRLKDYKGLQYSFSQVWGLIQQLFANYSPNGSVDQNNNIINPSTTSGENRGLRLVTGIDFADRPFYNISKNLLSELDSQSSLAQNQTAINQSANRFDLVRDLLRLWGLRLWIEGKYFYLFDYPMQKAGTQNGESVFKMIEHDTNGDPTEVETIEDIGIYVNNENIVLDGGRFYYKQGYSRSVSDFKIDSFGTDQSQTKNFTANQRNTKELKLNFGDLWQIGAEFTNPTTGGSVDIENQMTDVVSGATGTLIDIAQSRHEDIFFSPQKFFNGAIQSRDMNFTHVLFFKKEKYIPNSLTLNASQDEWSGEWIKAGDLAESILTSKTSNEFIQNKDDELIKVK